MATGSSGLPLFLIVVIRRVPHVWPPKIFVVGCAINQLRTDVQEMNPNFVVATLVCNFDVKCVVRDFESNAHANMPVGFGPRWLCESAYVSPFA